MRCLSCNKLLTPFESTRKYASTGEFLDLCNGCFKDVKDSIRVTENFLNADARDVEEETEEADDSY